MQKQNDYTANSVFKDRSCKTASDKTESEMGEVTDDTVCYELAEDVVGNKSDGNFLNDQSDGRHYFILEKANSGYVEEACTSNEANEQVADSQTVDGNIYDSTKVKITIRPGVDDTYSHLEKKDDVYNTTIQSVRTKDDIATDIDTYAHLNDEDESYSTAVTTSIKPADNTYSHLML